MRTIELRISIVLILICNVMVIAGCTIEASIQDISSKNNSTRVAASIDWPFNTLTTASYTFDPAKIDFAGDVARLTPTIQTDDATTAGTMDSGVFNGIDLGTLTSGAEGLKLGNAGGCDGSSLDCAKQSAAEIYELSESWTPQWASLVSYWKMSNDWNDSKGINTGTSNNGAGFTTSSKIGTYSGSLDGMNDYISTPSVNLGSAFSISFWAKISAGTGQIQTLIANATQGALSNGFKIFINSWMTNDQSITAETGNGATSSSAGTATGVFTYGVWHHLLVTFDRTAGIAQIYLNGENITSASAITTNFSTSAVLNIGQMTGNFSFFNGSVDDAAIWSTILTPVEVKTIYDRQSAAYSGTFTSRIMDAKNDSNWTTLSWIPTLPFLKELWSGPEKVDTLLCSG